MTSTIYVICNPTSGGNEGCKLMELADEKILFDDINIAVKIFDIRDGDAGNKKSFLEIKEDILMIKEAKWQRKRDRMANSISDFDRNVESEDHVDPVRVVLAGGDGTIMWGMMELGNHDISPEDIVVAALPLGTGNDFCRATGWGSEVSGVFFRKNLSALKVWVKEILSADVFNFDLWSIRIELNESTGYFNQIQGNLTTRLVHTKDGDHGEKKDENITELDKMCCNYFSTGVESRIGFGFEKRRSKSQLLNKFYYGTESMKKLLFKKHVRVKDYIKSISYQNEGNEVIIDPKKAFSSNPISLIFQNIPSMASGCDFWEGSYKHADREVKATTEAVTEYKNSLLKARQEIGDGKIELMTIKNLVSYSKAQAGILKGVAKRVAQANGPFTIEFDENYDNKVYFQIDGENYSCMNPTMFGVKYCRSYRILVKKGSILTKTSCQSKVSDAVGSAQISEKTYATRAMLPRTQPSPILSPDPVLSPYKASHGRSLSPEAPEPWSDMAPNTYNNWSPLATKSANNNSACFYSMNHDRGDGGGIEVETIEMDSILRELEAEDGIEVEVRHSVRTSSYGKNITEDSKKTSNNSSFRSVMVGKSRDVIIPLSSRPIPEANTADSIPPLTAARGSTRL